MAVINLTAPLTLPYTYRGATNGVANIVQIVTLPTRAGVTMVINNPEKSSKKLAVSFDQTLTDGGAGGANYLTVDEIVEFPLDGNAASGFPSVTKVALYSPAHTNVPFEIVFTASKPAH